MRLLSFASIFVLCFYSVEATAASSDQDRMVTAIAESWVGHDASALLTQWPIDSGFTTSEIVGTQETAYTFTFGQRAYIHSYEVSDGSTPVGTGPQGELVMQNNSHTEKEYVPQRIDCTVTFYANAQGILSHYDYSGGSCLRFFKHWGGPRR